jgi:cysteine desulfurase/selenocysteine lyase
MCRKKVYLDNARSSLYGPEILKCADEFTSMLANKNITPGDRAKLFRGYLSEARKKVAELINCTPEEIALVESTSHGLGIISQIIEFEPQNNVLICDLEYQASYLCLKRCREKIGFEIRAVKSIDGTITADIFRQYIDEQTKLIILASVQEINGYRCDVKAIADLAHRYGAYLAVDGVQEVGAMEINVKESGVDFYCAGSKKWIGSPYGMGFLYVRSEVVDVLSPPYDSYFNIVLPKQYEDYSSYLENPFRSPFDECNIVSTAQKFEIGGYRNYLGIIGLAKAIEILLRQDTKAIEEKIIVLNRRVTEGLRKLGIETESPKDREHMSSTVSFNLGFKNGNSSEEKKLVNFLLSRNIIVSLRCSTGTGGIRVSMHYYTTEEEIDTFLAVVGEYLSQLKEGVEKRD